LFFLSSSSTAGAAAAAPAAAAKAAAPVEEEVDALDGEWHCWSAVSVLTVDEIFVKRLTGCIPSPVGHASISYSHVIFSYN
jgi:hypothetical protein